MIAGRKCSLEQMDLSWLLAPLSYGELVQAWGKESLRVRREDDAYYSDLLSEEDLEFALHMASKVPGAVEELAEDENPRKCNSHAQAVEAFRRGKSLRIDSIQRFSYPISIVCRNLERAISCPINANMYLTPGQGKKALKRHYDTHDVFVLQVHGNKIWRLYDPPFPSPLEWMAPQRYEAVREMKQFRLANDFSGVESCILREELILKTGDFLYLPRGFWHEAESEEGKISCHLTLGIQPITYLDLLTTAIAQVSKTDLRLREPLPMGFSVTSESDNFVRSQIHDTLMHLPQNLNIESALSELSATFFRLHKAGFENELFRSGDSLLMNDMAEDTKIRIRKGMVCGVNRQMSPAQIIFGAKAFSIAEEYEEACCFISKMHQFAAAELPGNLTFVQKSVLINQLVSEGLLIVSDDRAAIPKQPEKITWLPIRLDPSAETVQWLDLENRTLKEPFLHQTVRQYKAEHPLAKTKTTSIRTLEEIKEDLPPSGFIWHISRCGSTLLSNALRTIPGTTVLSEPQPINSLLASSAILDSAMNGPDNAAYRDALLKGLIRAYGRRRLGNEKALVIKFSSWNILQISTVRRLWPTVPCIIIVRDPVEVTVSCIEEAPGWLQWKEQKDTVKSLLGWDVETLSTMSDLTFCAKVIGEFLRCAATAANTGCQILDYKDLTPDRVLDVARLFGIETPSDEVDAIRASFAIYSKDGRGQRAFADDGDFKQAKATDELRNEVHEWAQETYEDVMAGLGTTPVN
jgi:ribosomal protein L16 Arg81 hydroxylase